MLMLHHMKSRPGPGRAPAELGTRVAGAAIVAAVAVVFVRVARNGGAWTWGAEMLIAIALGLIAAGFALVRIARGSGESRDNTDSGPAGATMADAREGFEGDPISESDAEDLAPGIKARAAAVLALVVIGFLVFFLTRPARAQGASQQVAYVLQRGTDTAFVERAMISDATVSGDIAMRGGPRIAYVAERRDLLNVPRITFRVYAPGAPVESMPVQHGSLDIIPDSVIIQVEAGGANQRVASPIGGNPVPLFNGSIALLDLMVARARAAAGSAYTGTFVLVQGAGIRIEARVQFVGRDSVMIALGPVVHRMSLDQSGRLSGGTIPTQDATISRVTGAAAARISLGRPDYGAPADAPYTAEEVNVRSPEGHTLSGTFTYPRNVVGRAPAAITITGSGQQDRDSYISLVPGYRPFRQVADTLGRRGIAVLRLDDRGINGSGGDVAKATSADFANDVRAAVRFLRARADVDPDRIVLIGHSEGGMIAPMIAATDSKLAGIVLMAGPASSGRTIIDFQLRNLVMGDSAIPATRKDSAVKAQFAAWDSTAARSPWMQYFLDYDPIATLKRVKVPVLIVQGGTDQQVTPDQAPIIEKTLRESGNRNVTLHLFPNKNHLFIADSVGFPGNYRLLRDGRIDADVMGPLAEWVVLRTKPRVTP